MRRALASLALSLALAACNADVRFDPDGYRCDPGGACPAGYACVDDVCRRVDASACDGVRCDDAPAATCVDERTLRRFVGRCDAASGAPTCAYEPSDTACAAGCAGGACADPCAAVACVTPPEPQCADAQTLRAFAPTGTCAEGACTYAATDIPCAAGCAAGVCAGAPLCVGQTCTTPPPPVCVGGAQRTFAAQGACEPTTGQCRYASTDTPCPAGCAGGACVPAAATFEQRGPRVRFAVRAVDQAPGSSGSTVVAVGASGRVAWWNGVKWTELINTPSSASLNRVQFVSSGLAYIAGANRTLWTFRPGTGVLMASALSGPSGANLVGLSGRNEADVLVAGESGEWWRLTGMGWSSGTLPSSEGPFRMTSAYLDETGRERIAGRCDGRSCVAYRFVGGVTPSWVVDTQSDPTGFSALGGGFDAATVAASEVFCARGAALVSHSNVGNFTPLSTTFTGERVVGITAEVGASSRDVYVQTASSASVKGRLYRVVRSPTASALLTSSLGQQALGPTESSGVIVADTNPTAGVNTITRRSTTARELLDVGADLAGASLDDSGALVLATTGGDVATLRAGRTTYDLAPAPADLVINAVEARRGPDVLLAGRRPGGGGVVYRVAPGAGFSQVGLTPGTTWNALCRASNLEAWVVGSGGAIARVGAAGLTVEASPTTADLLAIDCAPGLAVATGANGTVLVRSGGQWVAAPPLPGMTAAVTGVALADRGRVTFVAGDGVFARLEAGAWTSLPPMAGLKGLVARGPNDVYGAVGTGAQSDLMRFDGARWGPSLLRVTGALRGGVQMDGRVVWGGSAGAVVEGR